MLNHGSLVRGLTLVFVGAALGVAGTLWINLQTATVPDPVEIESGATEADPGRLDDVVHEIRQLAQGLRTGTPIARELVDDGSKSNTPGSEGVLVRLLHIEGLLERIEGQISASVGTPGIAAKFPKNTAALGSLLGTSSTLQTQDHFCWTPLSIYKKYGVPDTPHWSPAKMEWHYQMPEHKVIFTFAQGVVIDVTIW